jgi:sterol desaturase/sphingolipid hydroxylase (fatty acid hydroxylase superfamily)
MIGIPIGLIYSNAGEWLIHKYVLHGLGRRKKSFWSFHWHEHHKASRRNAMRDEAYDRPLRGWNAQTKEAVAIFGVALAHLPLLPVAPFFVGTVWYSAVHYHRVHRRAHLDPVWAEEHLPWHVDHHLGVNQDANWCVTRPWFDEWMGTRIARDAAPLEAAS